MSSTFASMSVNSSGLTSSMMSSMTNTLSFGRYVWSVALMSRDGGGDDLHLVAAEPLDLFEQEHVGRLGDGDGEHAFDEEQRQDLVLLEEFLGQDRDDLRVGDLRADRARTARRTPAPAPR